jgi:hypothetical protein
MMKISCCAAWREPALEGSQSEPLHPGISDIDLFRLLHLREATE